VRNEAGQTNLISLASQADARQADKTRNRASDFEFAGIDVLNLSLGKVRFLDLKNPRQNSELNMDVRNRVFRNVNSEGDVFGVLLMLWLRGASNTGKPMPLPPEIISSPAADQKTARAPRLSH